MPSSRSFMPVRRRRETFVWRFRNPPSAIWPSLADTDRFNEAAGLPRYVVEETPREDGGVDFRGVGQISGMNLRWREQPSTWVHERWFLHERYFENGPLSFVGARLELFPEGEGARAEYTLEAEARTMLGRLLIATRFFEGARKNFGELARQADAFASGDRPAPFETPKPELQPGADAKLSAAAQAIEASPYGHGLSRRLVESLAAWPEVDARKIRPLALARAWSESPRRVVELCLQAVRSEILGLRWDLLCPRCQVAKAQAPSLDQLPTKAHCGSCNIDYGRDFANNVELSFFPAQSVRRTDDREFCLFGPMSTPHVRAQLRVSAGETVRHAIDLASGRYRLRSLEAGGETVFDWLEGPLPVLVAYPDDAGSTAFRTEPAPADRQDAAPDELTLRNDTRVDRIFVIEELGWRRDALTADRATTFQAFSDLFDQQILRPGDHLAIDHVSFLFADIKGSTALYQAVGDAQAYATARAFFALFGAAIRETDGVLVKTIGDGVHAAFANPADALRCALSAQRAVAAHNAEHPVARPLVVKIGLHAGRSINVTLNGRLDYYGATVNACARLSDQSLGGDVAMSESFAAEPALAETLSTYQLERATAPMKGIGDAVPFYRLSGDQILGDAA